MAGQSRSVTVALSFIMKQEGVSETDALEAMRVKRSDAKPIGAFLKQLELYHQLGYVVDSDHPEVKKLRRSTSRIPRVRSNPDITKK
jgi:protein-tyrosine phosphatase